MLLPTCLLLQVVNASETADALTQSADRQHEQHNRAPWRISVCVLQSLEVLAQQRIV
jgi:hypothetical protein